MVCLDLDANCVHRHVCSHVQSCASSNRVATWISDVDGYEACEIKQSAVKSDIHGTERVRPCTDIFVYGHVYRHASTFECRSW